MVDADGFYKIGDAVRFLDRPILPRACCSMVASPEDFKLLTGTWANVGNCASEPWPPGADHPDPWSPARTWTSGLLVFPNFEGAARLAGLDSAAAPAEIIANDEVQKALCQRMAAYNRENPGLSNRIARV
jgi:feruloyl-CoA synthase